MNAVKSFKVVIIGSGFGGQSAAIHLSRMGIDDYIVLERRSFIGGTWIQNRYPGAAVDVQSPLYSLSFEPYDWSRMFAHQDELEQYTQHIFDKYNLREKTQTNASVSEIRWHDSDKQWHIQLASGESFDAQFVINATGPLSTPITPKIEGSEQFQGISFHTNDWDTSVDLTGKTVAIMGSGASAAQAIPAIVDKVKALHVFQRTPHWIIPRWDIVFSNWQRKLLRKKPFYNALRWLIYWTLEIRILGFKYSKAMLNIVGKRPALKHLNSQVQDVNLREQLTPDFTIGCKRIIISSTLYPALTHQNTTLHTKDDGIASLTPTGIRTTTGKDIDVDVLVYATGFDAADGIISYPVIGRNDQLLSEKWSDYPRAYLGISVPEFPNLFIVTGPNTGIGHTSAIFVIESQMRYIMKSIQIVDNDKAAKSIEVKKAAEQRYTERIHRSMQKTVWQTGGCNSWYKSKSGKVTAMFPGFSFVYRIMCKWFKRSDHIVSS